MDWKSHGLIGLLLALIMGLNNLTDIFILVFGSILPDLSVIFFMIYFNFNKRKILLAFTNNKEKPKFLFVIYNLIHSLFFVMILFILSYFYKPILYLSLGILLHIIIDIPLHKDHPIRPFYPINYVFKKGINWWDYYGKNLKSRLIIWLILIILILIVLIFRY